MPKTNKMMKMSSEQRSQRMREVRSFRKQPGYFATLSKEELAAISQRGGLGKKNAENKETQTSGEPS